MSSVTSLPVESEKVQTSLISLPKEFQKIQSLDDSTLYDYLEHHPNINRMYVLGFVFLILIYFL